MDNRTRTYLDKLSQGQGLNQDDFLFLLDSHDHEARDYAQALAAATKEAHYGTKVFVRGLIEISNYCKNDCYYCGIRKSNRSCVRYRLSKDDILECAQWGYHVGIRTFVLQGGEDPLQDDTFLCGVVGSLKERFPDCAITLSLGERSHESYRRLREAGADRYLLRHETASSAHYEKLHPESMSYENRMSCLAQLKSLGFATGCGFMVGSPFQTNRELARDLAFIQEFQPEMCGIGPFIPHKETPFSGHVVGSVELTCYLLSLIRLIKPTILLPATTALSSLASDGWERGLRAGANVLMPNLSPARVREHYLLYNNKEHAGIDSAEDLHHLKERLEAIGHCLVIDRGDPAA